MPDALPLAQLLLYGIPAFLAGVAVGRYQERHKETFAMDLAAVVRQWYDRWAPLLVVATAVLAVTGIIISTVATVTNAQQDRKADASTRAVQKCFDLYALAQSASSKAVREASEAKDIATAARDDALNAEGRAFKSLVDKLRTRSVTDADIALLAEALRERDAAGRALDRAQADLDRARQENPIPDAPSEFCSVKP